MPDEVIYPAPIDPKYDYKKPPVEFTYERRMRYLYELRKHGLQYKAAEMVGVSTGTVSSWRKKEKEFDEACNEAKQRWIDEVLVTEATRRAVEGVEHAVIGGQFRDQIILTEREYSDSLLMFLMRSQRPEFREAPVHSNPGGTGPYDLSQGGVLVVTAPPPTPDEWEAQHGPSCRKPEDEK